MEWKTLLSPHRVGSSKPGVISQDRSPFQRDFDRIVFSGSFRRLQDKTQVFPLAKTDYVRTRLTHSLEASSIGRSLGTAVGVFICREFDTAGGQPSDVGAAVAAAALAHDIGNPPLGHAGEEAIRHWFTHSPVAQPMRNMMNDDEAADIERYEGNAQGFRVLTRLEMPDQPGGMQLTCATLGAFAKYPCASRVETKPSGVAGKKFNFFRLEQEFFKEVAESTGLVQAGPWAWQRHPLSYLLEAADDVCYRIIDMEDARELRIISYEDILDVLEPLKAALNIDEEKQKAMDSDRRRAGFLRAQLISHIVRSLGRTFEDKYAEIMEGRLEGSLLKHAESDVADYLERAKRIFTEKILNNNQKISLEVGAYNLYRRLLDVFIPACFKVKMNRSLTYQEERALHLMGVNAPTHDDDLYQSYLRVLDFISGMTDDYATFISRQFSGTAG